MAKRFVFVGVTTKQSSMMQIFPLWRDILRLGEDTEIVPHDLPIGAPPKRYRETISWLSSDPDIIGALVTTHKLALFKAGKDLFTDVDNYARLLEEVSCIARRGDRLLGWAKDPISARRALHEILTPGQLAGKGGEVLCFGAGGAGSALSLCLVNETDSPARMTITDMDNGRLQDLKALHARLGTSTGVDFVHTEDPVVCDELTARLPPYSLVINATGMGKDRPGSPVSDAVQFPENGTVWELNYRGELLFLHQAWNQRNGRRLRVEDGWRYFIFGWTTVIEEVFQRPISDDDLRQLAAEAAFARPVLPTSSGQVL